MRKEKPVLNETGRFCRELFARGFGANFNIRRMLGANDFSLDCYSYDEVPEDFTLKSK
jgi:glucosylceramidase